MKVQLIGLYDRGDIHKERVHLRATADVDLSFYVIFDTLYTGPTAIQATQKTSYWFPPKKLKSGEHVVIKFSNGGRDYRSFAGRVALPFHVSQPDPSDLSATNELRRAL